MTDTSPRRPRTAKKGNPTGAMSLMDHLRELRTRIIISAVASFVGMLVVYFLYGRIFEFATGPYCDSVVGTEQTNCDLVYPSLTAGFALRLRISGYLGMVVALPVIAYQLWKFIAPALYSKEKKYAAAFVGSSVFLFAMGGTLAFVSLSKIFQWFVQQSSQGQILNQADSYFRLLALMVVAFGVAFEFPLVLAAAQMMHLVTPAQLAAKRRHAILGIVTVVAIITPGGDPVSLVALSVPLIIFYEGAIWIGRAFLRRSS